ncbi:hypothetical protein LTR50_006052 [Elasticomyces elasticus]|nr:hypothetical protein LTR50_006052 [Elasticomyces elasticus]
MADTLRDGPPSHFHPSLYPQAFHPSPPLRHSSKIDEGYSEETRSQADSDTPMHLDSASDDMDHNHGQMFAIPDIVLGMSEEQRSNYAFAILRSLRTSSIASIVERLNPYLHLDPVLRLPPEITFQIFAYLRPNDLLKASMASRSWRERALDSRLWRVMFGCEGWEPNTREVRTYEQEMDRKCHQEREEKEAHFAMQQQQRPYASLPERKTSKKRTHDESLFGETKKLLVGGGDAEQWSEQHGVIEADDNGMHDVEPSSLAPSRPISRDQHWSFVGLPDHKHSPPPHRESVSTIADAPSIPTFQPIKPALIVTESDRQRVNFPYLYKQRRRLEENWRIGQFSTFRLPHADHDDEAHRECVYTIQFSGNHLVSGSRDKTIRRWDLSSQRLIGKPLEGHKASVLCLQFDSSPEEDVIMSGGSDSHIIIWRFSTGEIIKRMDKAHDESVLNLRFDHRYLITCSKDKTIKIWNRKQILPDDDIVPINMVNMADYSNLNPIPEYTLLSSLEGHVAAVNAIQVHENEIVSASGDRTVKVWDIKSGDCTRTLIGHSKGIACVQYDGRRVVSGSSDNTVRIFDVATGAEVAWMLGHTNLVRTVQARFGDLPGQEEELEAQARAIDEKFFAAQMNGLATRAVRSRGPRNPGSSDPKDILAYGAKLPPGGGGSRWSRIVSGSYDESVVIWKKDSEGRWIAARRLRLNEVLEQHRARRPRVHAVAQPPAAQSAGIQHLAQQMAQQTAPASAAGQQHQQQAHPYTQPANAVIQSTPQIALPPNTNSTTNNVPQQSATNAAIPSAPPMPTIGTHPMAHLNGIANRERERESNRVFKLQFDTRRIICCSQNTAIVGWDFACGDHEIEEASRFFSETN